MTFTPLSALGYEFGLRHELPAPAWEGISFQERADIGCILLTLATHDPSALEKAENTLGCRLPRESGTVLACDDFTGLWLSPRHWLLLCLQVREGGLVAAVETAFPGHEAHASAYSDSLCWLSLDGDDVEELLKQGGFVTLADGGLATGHARRTRLCGIAVVLYHAAPTRWLVAVERSRARYFLDQLGSYVRL